MPDDLEGLPHAAITERLMLIRELRQMGVAVILAAILAMMIYNDQQRVARVSQAVQASLDRQIELSQSQLNLLERIDARSSALDERLLLLFSKTMDNE